MQNVKNVMKFYRKGTLALARYAHCLYTRIVSVISISASTLKDQAELA